jgi:hypothetical protein
VAQVRRFVPCPAKYAVLGLETLENPFHSDFCASAEGSKAMTATNKKKRQE